MASLLKKIVKIHEYYTTQQIRMFTNTQRHNYVTSYPTSIALTAIVNLVTADSCVLIAESVGSRRELVANSCTHRRRDATKQFRRVGVGVGVGVGGVYWALAYNLF